ncbi:MAG: PAS domain S-box protein [Firmicutes bacterium]|nr:PAS domain S-box protein [Bacillota bacterium]
MEKEEMSANILSNISELVYVRDLQKNILYMNRMAEKITGWQSGEAVQAKKCFEVFGDSRGRCRDNCPVDSFLEKKYTEYSFERPIRTRNGQIMHFNISISPLVFSGRVSGGIVVMQDITHLKEYQKIYGKTVEQLNEEIAKRELLEKSLLESEKKYRTTFEHTGSAMVVIEEDDTISMANRELERITGYSLEELVGKSWHRFVHPEDLERLRGYHAGRRRPGHSVPRQYELRTMDKSGHTRELFCTINLIPGTSQSIGSLLDITDRKQMERALRESEEKYRLLLETIEDGFYEVDLAGNLIHYNDAMAGIHELSDKDSYLGVNYRDYTDKESAARVFKAYNQVFSTGQPEKGFTWEMVTRKGARKILEASITLARDSSGKPTGFRGIIRDITERRQAEERLKYLSMHDVVTGLYNRTYFEQEMTRLCHSRFSPVTVICCDVDGMKLVNDTFGHKKGDDLLKAVAEVLRSPFRTSDVVARTGGDEFAILLPKTSKQAARRVLNRIKKAIENYNRKGAGLPIKISMGTATGRVSREKEFSCSELYRQADNDMYRQKLQNKINSRGSMVSSLMKALDDRDFLSQGHARRVFEYAQKLGVSAGLSARELTDLDLLAQYHDLGKVGISDHILFKAGPLNPKKWEEMKEHSEIGFRIARSTPELSSIADFILYHHEWWNGQGYPLGSKGQEIPLLCRVFSIADAYDAMTSDRPYRKAMTPGDALGELEKGSGTQFDPHLIKMFLEILGKTDSPPRS